MYNHKNRSANKRLPEAFGIIQTVCDTTLGTYRGNIRMHLYAQKSQKLYSSINMHKDCSVSQTCNASEFEF